MSQEVETVAEATEEIKTSMEELMELFDELSFKEKWRRVSEGLKQPKDSGEYKWARFQMVRLSAPVAAVVLPLFAIFLMALFTAMAPAASSKIEVRMMEPEPMEEKLDEIKEEIIPPEEIPEPEVVDTDVISDSPYVGADPNATPGPVADFSPVPVQFDAVALVKSPVIFKGIYGSRSPGARGSALAGGGGGSATEAAVLRALRWLKKNQASDGSWPRTKPAMTGLALLAYLAHGDTPASEEFGLTVESALKWMLENQEADGRFKGRDGHDYSHPIAAYALSEAYAMTMIPDLKYAAEKAINVIVKGQQASGGWDYNCKASSTRNDTSYAGWCAQALKAAQMAGLEVDGLEAACKKAIDGLKANAKGDYNLCGFGYTAPGQTGLTAVGALCMQLLGAGNADEVTGALKLMDTDKWAFSLVDPPIGKSGLYFFYYATQAKFHAGGETWNRWNKQFSPQLVKGQHVITKDKSGYCDHKGQPRDIGYWDQYLGHGNNENPVFSTLLGVLQLEVYYRYLPTFKTPAGDADAAAAAAPAGKKEEEAKIDIQF
jgi:hypothetical protein